MLNKYFKANVNAVLFEEKKGFSWADKCLQKLFRKGTHCDMHKEFVDKLGLMHRYVYRGSLTTPPYSEYLLWNMAAKVVPINNKTLKLF